MNSDEIIGYNIRKHDKDAESYQTKHKEIYNSTEQHRIHALLTGIKQKYFLGVSNVKAFDFGCGTGNLTNHLLAIGFDVTAADVSPKSLEFLKERVEKGNGEGELTTLCINGIDLSSVPDGEFDVVCTYSVLHHIPDYLFAVEEMARILKPGGALYIDHEVCPSYWIKDEQYTRYINELNKLTRSSALSMFVRKSKKIFSMSSWKRLVMEKVLGKRMINEEGDIHVYPDDHIEWEKISEKLGNDFFVDETDYLVCREGGVQPELWHQWKDKIVDMRCLIAQKRIT